MYGLMQFYYLITILKNLVLKHLEKEKLKDI